MNNQASQSELEDVKKKIKRKWTADLIIKETKKLFVEKGLELSMHDIARKLNTRASSIYRHIESKRELWFALTIDDFKVFSDDMDKIIRAHQGTSVKLLKKIGKQFIDFANEDFNRFQLLFLYEPPKTDSPGPYELQCNPDSLSGLIKLCDLVIKEEKLKRVTAENLAVQMLSIVLGFSVLISPINDYLLEQKMFENIRSEAYKIQFLESSVEGILAFYK